MKNLATFSLFLVFSFSSIFAQSKTCDCKKDLDFVVEKMQKMTSFKKQVKGDKKDLFENTYQELASKMKTPLPVEECYKLLLQQTLLVNDVHFSLSYKNEIISKDIIEDSLKLASFKSSEDFKNHPKINIDLKDLKQKLEAKPLDAIEGIYNYGEFQKIGVYFSEEKKEYIGVLLENTLSQWEVGEVRFRAIHTNDNKYNLYYYDADTRKPGFVKSISLENGRLWSYKKDGNNFNHELPIKEQSNWEFKSINDSTQYIYLGTFSNRDRKKHNSFYDEVKSKLTAENVIVDLRSNSGGNDKYSDPYLKLLKNKNVYVLTNCFTGSNGEQFTHELKKLKNSKHLGQTTRGVIAYGMNYGYVYDLPSGNFEITPTDMNFHKFIEFEGKGIFPEIPLDFDKDWVEQTLEIIASENK
ncbi:S41 family peptidase [Psychroserpens sp. Hel_I_66]|uniref:S41 family peptidase n=1 Tax=Psychroserpens sp. Hel_I_66 TaxID=1250004 RepID=UPI00068C11A7|nr:S41 family peptidase [Psychroserpens sp. Hel_I_66]